MTTQISYYHGLLFQPDCQNCYLRYDTKVLPDGPIPARIAFVGEGPGCAIPGQYSYFKEEVIPPRVIEDDLIIHPVKQKFSGYYNGEIAGIVALGHKIVLTQKHKVLIKPVRENKSGSHLRRELGDSIWVQARHVPSDAFVVIAKPVPLSNNDVPFLHLAGFEVGLQRFKGRVADKIEVSGAIAIALGLFVGDGCSYSKSGVVSWHLSQGYKAKYVKLITDWLDSLGVNYGVKRKGKHINVCAYSTKFARFFDCHFYSRPPGSRGKGTSKKIPDFVWSWPAKRVSQLLFGWHEADGKHVRNLTKPKAISTVSHQAFAQGIDLLLRLGVVPTVSAQPPKRKGKQVCYYISLGNKSVRQLAWPLLLHDKKERRLYQEDDRNFYVPITKITKEHYRGPVYDQETLDHTYNMPFIVHNSSEKSEGRGFVGPSGQALWHLAKMAGISREEVWVTNAALCQERNVKLTTTDTSFQHKSIVKAVAAKCCRARLVAELRYVNPQVIVPLGNWALWALSDIQKAKIYAYRGSRMDVNLDVLLQNILEGKTNAPIKTLKKAKR